MKTILFVDGSNNFIRCYMANPTLNADGEPYGGTIGFLTSLRSFCWRMKPDEIYIAWDGEGGSQKRKKIIENYKGGRKIPRLNRFYESSPKEQDDNRIKQLIALMEYLLYLPVHQIRIDNIEADDIIAYLNLYYEKERKIIVSGDYDFYQLLNENTIIYPPKKKIFITQKDCLEKFGVHPNNYALAKSIAGDSSDNIKGIYGIAYKKLLKFFPEFSLKEKIEAKQLLKKCKKNKKKYNKFIDGEDIIIRNFEAIQLEVPIISSVNIGKIKKKTKEELNLNATSFRVKLLEDGIKDIDNNFFSTFRYLIK